MAQNIEEKIVFAVSPEGQGDGVPLIMLGIPRGAWLYMKDGKTHNFDLTSIGLPIKLMLFGAKDHGAAMAVIEEAMRVTKTAYLNKLNEDFSIKPK